MCWAGRSRSSPATTAARFLAGPGEARNLAILHDNTLYARYLAERTRSANDELKLGMNIVFFDDIAPAKLTQFRLHKKLDARDNWVDD